MLNVPLYRVVLAMGKELHVRRTQAAGLALVSCVLVAQLSGCGGGPSPAGAADTSPPATTSASPGGLESPGAAPSPGGSPARSPSAPNTSQEGLAWVPFGPDDPTFPDDTWAAYNSFAQHDCGVVASTADRFVDLGPGMVAVCLAVIEGQDGQWDAVGQSLTAQQGSGHPCLSAQVKSLLERAYAWHQRHPGRMPAVRFHIAAGNPGQQLTDCGKQEHASPPDGGQSDPASPATSPDTPPPASTTDGPSPSTVTSRAGSDAPTATVTPE